MSSPEIPTLEACGLFRKIGDRVLSNFVSDATFRVTVTNDVAVRSQVLAGKVQVGLVLPRGFGADAPSGLFRHEPNRHAHSFAVILVVVMLGGAWMPTFIFPSWLQTVSLFTPTRWPIDTFDAMTWRGLGLEALLVPAGAMLAWTVLFAGIALWKFRREEEG